MVQLLHVAAISSLALARPLFSALADDPAYLVWRQVEPGELWGVLTLLLVGLPLLLSAPILLLARFDGRLADSLTLVVLGPLLLLLLAPLSETLLASFDLSASGDVSMVLAVAGAGALTGAYARWALVRKLVTCLAPAPLVLIILFATNDGVSPLLSNSASPTERVAAIPATTPVMVVVFDELPLTSLMASPEGLDAHLFPNFARLAGHSTWYRNASAGHEDTALSVASLLTASRPAPGALPVPEENPLNLFSLVSGTHRIVAREAVTALHAADDEDSALDSQHSGRLLSLIGDLARLTGQNVLPEPFASALADGASRQPSLVDDSTDTAQGPGTKGKPAQTTTVPPPPSPEARMGRFRSFIEDVDGDSAPALWFLHTRLPREPWERLPSGKRYIADDPLTAVTAGRWSDDQMPADRGLQRHLLQLGLADRLLGELIDELQALGLWDRLMLVVTSSRGLCFEPGLLYRRIEPDNAADVARVPLFIKLPGQESGEIDDRNAELVDVMPTIADHLGLTIDWIVDGHSLLDDTLQRPGAKIIQHVDGEVTRLSGDVPQTWPGLEHKLALFGARADWADIYSMASSHGLAGRSLADVGIAGMLPIDGYVSGIGVTHTTDDVVPVHIEGFLSASDRDLLPERIAVTVDDVIAVTAPTRIEVASKVSFSALVPEAALSGGSHRLAVYAVEGDDDDPQLSAIDLVSYELRAATATEPEAIIDSFGRVMPVMTGAFDAFIDQTILEGKRLRLTGWSADALSARVADIVLVFRDERFVRAGLCGSPRPEVAAQLGIPRLMRCGFDFELPVELLGEDYSSHVRVFTLVDDLAVEARPSPNARWLSHVEHRLVNETTLWGSDGKAVAVTPGAAIGEVTSAILEDNRIVLRGWAADLRHNRGVEEIEVLIDGAHAHTFVPDRADPKVNSILGLAPSVTPGFSVMVPRRWLTETGAGQLRLFARVGSHATELHYGPLAAWIRDPSRAPVTDDK